VDVAAPAPARTPRTWLPWAALIVLAAAFVAWEARRLATVTQENPLANATFTPFTNFEGAELDAAISPDGNFVAFVANRTGPFHIFLSRVGSGRFDDLTPGQLDQRNPGLLRSVGFSGDGSEIWRAGTAGRRLDVMPLLGGAPRAFLNEHTVNVAWSRDGTRLVYFTYDPGDPLSVADGARVHAGACGDV
jgi:Tol biopolymer transport system component